MHIWNFFQIGDVCKNLCLYEFVHKEHAGKVFYYERCTKREETLLEGCFNKGVFYGLKIRFCS